uniref:Protein MCM10 homolog n=1 Tax=Paramormyrops kingsleyae TaxID=1676925 RepID=A0A3B3R556_9TELE|nr:protein MCM10 homolog [Paramormyrops kingsleyae]XP_023673531.1 protein MCM10 homolog [Paramormyrops kingsleyae]XP_023673532.1 protein MCM10 homolog [Paramormyrops kingsleyae]
MEGEDDLDILTSLLEENDTEEPKVDDLDDLFDNDDDNEEEFDDGQAKDESAKHKEDIEMLFGDVDDMEEESMQNETSDTKASDSYDKSKEELAAELRHMQEQMRKLQQKLEASHSSEASRPSQNALPAPGATKQGGSSDSPAPLTQRSHPTKSQESTKTDPHQRKQRINHQTRPGPAAASAVSYLVGQKCQLMKATDAAQTVPRTSATHDATAEKFSGLRLRRPRVSSIEMEQKMGDRRLIRLSQLPERLAREKLDETDWVTFAVVVSKVTPQSNSSGKTFSIWKLNDLRDLEVYVNLFLFGEVHKEHWKTDPGTVIGILNPNPMKPKEGSDGLCLSVEHPQKILLMGEALDFGTCKATKKNGDPCRQLVNLHECQFCQYHVKAQYKSMSSKRAELQSSFSGKVAGKARGKGAVGLKERLCQSGFHYGGVSSMAFATSVSGSQQKKPKQTTLSNLFVRGADQIVSQARRLAMATSEVTGCSDDFKSLLSMQTPGALNLKKHLRHNTSGSANAASPGVQSISAGQLLKQQKQQLMEARRRKSENLQQRFLQNNDKVGPKMPSPEAVKQSPTGQGHTPKLGRGFSEGQDVLFFDHTPTAPTLNLSAAKLAALKKLRQKGAALAKEDPNSVKRKRPNASDITNRVEQNRESPSGGSEPELEEPELKRRREHLEYLQSDAFQKILNAKSRHLGVVQDAEFQIQEKYFDALVKKEQMEEKMRNIREMKCRAVTCKTCKYTYFKPLDRCVEDKHEYHWHDALKRFFKCPCGQRAIALDRMPHKHCSNCGLFKWERDGMIKEKSGPKIGGELLLPRGEEQPKFLNGLK